MLEVFFGGNKTISMVPPEMNFGNTFVLSLIFWEEGGSEIRW